jgi:hypothetical protein
MLRAKLSLEIDVEIGGRLDGAIQEMEGETRDELAHEQDERRAGDGGLGRDSGGSSGRPSSSPARA